MTYFYAASTVAGNNQEKLQIEIWTTPDIDAIGADDTEVEVHIRYSAYQTYYSGDNQTLNRFGSWSGSTNFYMPASANTTVTIADDWRYVSTEIGNSVEVGVGGNITGHYGGASFSAEIWFDIDGRPDPISKPTLSSNSFDMGTSITINTNRLNSNFTHTIRYKFNNASGTIATGVGASTTWNSPIATLAPQIPTSASGTGIIYCDTYKSGNLVGTASVRFTAAVPNTTIPTIGAVNVSESVSSINTLIGKYVKLLSKLTGNLTGCAGIYGSSITKQEIIIDNVSYDVTQAGATSLTWTMANPVISSGSVTIMGRVTDSRGRIGTLNNVITVIDYSLPAATSFTVQRCLSNGTLDQTGTYVKCISVASITSLINVTEKNVLKYQIDYRLRGATTWTNLKSLTTLAVGTLSLNATETLGSGQFAATTAYEFLLTIQDQFSTTVFQFVIGTSELTLSLSKTGIGVGKAWEQGTVDAAGLIYEGGIALQDKYVKGPTNYLINAVGFPINQRRRTSYTANGYMVDRWYLGVGTGSANTVTPSVVTLGKISDCIKNYLAWNRTTAGTSSSGIYQKIEAVQSLAGKAVTLSVLCDTASGSVDIYPWYKQYFGTGGSPSADVNYSGSVKTATTTLQKLTWTFTIPAITGKTLGTSGTDALEIGILRAYNSANGATGTINIYAVQIEPGIVSSDFLIPSYQTTLALCQRYYYRQTSDSTVTEIAFGIAMTAGNSARALVPVPVPMRARPAIESTGTPANYRVDNYSQYVNVSAMPTVAEKATTATTNPLTIGMVMTLASSPDEGYLWTFMSSVAANIYLGFNAEL